MKNMILGGEEEAPKPEGEPTPPPVQEETPKPEGEPTPPPVQEETPSE